MTSSIFLFGMTRPTNSRLVQPSSKSAASRRFGARRRDARSSGRPAARRCAGSRARPAPARLNSESPSASAQRERIGAQLAASEEAEIHQQLVHAGEVLGRRDVVVDEHHLPRQRIGDARGARADREVVDEDGLGRRLVDQLAIVARQILEARVGGLDEDVRSVAGGAQHLLDAEHLVADRVAVAERREHLVHGRRGAPRMRRAAAEPARRSPASSPRRTPPSALPRSIRGAPELGRRCGRVPHRRRAPGARLTPLSGAVRSVHRPGRPRSGDPLRRGGSRCGRAARRTRRRPDAGRILRDRDRRGPSAPAHDARLAGRRPSARVVVGAGPAAARRRRSRPAAASCAAARASQAAARSARPAPPVRRLRAATACRGTCARSPATRSAARRSARPFSPNACVQRRGSMVSVNSVSANSSKLS